MEGSDCFNPPANCDDGTLELPILEYDHSLGCSITGGYRHRGDENTELSGIYFFGDFCSGRIWGATQDGTGEWTAKELLATDLAITAFGEDEDGEIYVAHFSQDEGAIYRIAEISDSSSSSSGGGGGGGASSCFISTAAPWSSME